MVDFSPFAQRRLRVVEQLGDEDVLVLFAAREQYRNNDVTYPFRQDSDFYYLTGLDEPDAVLAIRGGRDARSVLFVNARDPEREAWDGPRLGVDGVGALGVEGAFSVAQLDEQLPKLLEGRQRLWCRFGVAPMVEERLGAAWAASKNKGRRGQGYPTQLADVGELVHELRRRKQPEELALMQKAVDVSAEAHRAAMRKARPGVYEYEIEAVLRSAFRTAGSQRVAYQPIVGSGENATVLHYVENRRRMQDGDLLLVDAGCEYEYYAADITRTFPVSGRFTAAQRAVYDVVLAAQVAAIDAVRPGATMASVHRAALRVICQGLVDLKVVEGDVASVEEQGTYKPFFMHQTGHYLGMDVHDVGRYYDAGEPRAFEPGVVVTVEPGLYFAASAPSAAARYRGVGIRIEDDVLVTEDGCRVLSSDVPKRPDEVERACAE